MIGQNSSADILYSKKDHKRVRNLLALHTTVMTLVGQCPYIIEEWFPRSLRGLGKSLAYLHSGFIITQTFHLSIFFAKTTIDEFQNGKLNDITDALTQVIICSLACFSTCYFLWHKNTLRQFIAFINENYWHHSLIGLSFVTPFSAYVKARRLMFLWIMSGICGVSFYGLVPLLMGAHTLPLKCWYPFDPLQSWVYPLIYIMQMSTQYILAFTFCSGSGLYVAFVLLILGQFDVLFCSLKNLKFHAQILSGVNFDTLREHQLRLPSPKDDEVNQYMFSKEELTDLKNFQQSTVDFVYSKPHFQKALHESIVKCIQLHHFICKCCKILESFYHPYCLVKSLQITIQLCLLVFVGDAGEKSLMRYFALLQYLGLTIFDLLFFTFCGELLRQHSVRVGEALWRSDWTSYAKIIRKDLMIFLINSQRPIILTAGKFFVMDINRLRLVFMQAFSFLALLQKIENKNK